MLSLADFVARRLIAQSENICVFRRRRAPVALSLLVSLSLSLSLSFSFLSSRCIISNRLYHFSHLLASLSFRHFFPFSLLFSLSLAIYSLRLDGIYRLAASDRTSRTKTLSKSVIEKVRRFLIRMIKVREMDLSARADTPRSEAIRLFFHRRRAGGVTSRNRYSRCAIGQETPNVCRRCAFPRWKCSASFSRRRGGGTFVLSKKGCSDHERSRFRVEKFSEM